MRIKFLRDWSGRLAGEVHDLETSVANRLIKHGYARAQFATGGIVTGRGSGTSDSVPALLSHGGYIVPDGSVPDPTLSLINEGELPAQQPTDSPDTGTTEKEES